MDYTNLNDSDVKEIIDRLKYPKRLLNFNEIRNAISSLFGKIDIDEAIIDDYDVQYILHILEGKGTLIDLVFIFALKNILIILFESISTHQLII
ncbi:TPA: hypothetical protein U3L57_000118 [Streptococcus agalactiae]|nr:hypothetical protein [Streptococcus agalactiae]